MAKYGNGKLKYWYVTCLDGYKTLFQKQCQTVGEANQLLAEKKEEYKDNRNVMVYKEQF